MIIKFPTIVTNKYRASTYKVGSISSAIAVSLVNLLIILPDGFTSKNLVLVLTTPSKALSCNILELLTKEADSKKFLIYPKIIVAITI
jgi:hypothetical protein